MTLLIDEHIKQNKVVDGNADQIITRFGYSLIGKAKRWFNQGTDVWQSTNVADCEALKEQFTHQGKASEEQMTSLRNSK